MRCHAGPLSECAASHTRSYRHRHGWERPLGQKEKSTTQYGPPGRGQSAERYH